jgi:hypothetical protein
MVEKQESLLAFMPQLTLQPNPKPQSIQPKPQRIQPEPQKQYRTKEEIREICLKNGACPDCNVPVLKVKDGVTGEEHLVCPSCGLELSDEQALLTGIIDPITTVAMTSRILEAHMKESVEASYLTGTAIGGDIVNGRFNEWLGTYEADGVGKHFSRGEIRLLTKLKRKR